MKTMRVRWNHVSLVGFAYEKNILLEVCVSNPLKEYVIHIVQTVERSRRFKPTLREKCPNTKFSLVCIFPHSNWIRRDAEYLSVFSPNARKYGSEKAPYLDTFHAELMAQFQSQR